MTGNTKHFKFFSVPLKWLGTGDFKVLILPGLKVLTNFKLSLYCISFDFTFLWHLQHYWYVTGRQFLMSKEKLEETCRHLTLAMSHVK
jgi:hypothetical protein